MSWRQLTESVQSLAAHIMLFTTTLFLVLKLDLPSLIHGDQVSFAPLWLFHALMAPTRFSLPAPSIPHDPHWAPCHAVVATPLLVSFELLLCVYLETANAYGYEVVNLKIGYEDKLEGGGSSSLDEIKTKKSQGVGFTPILTTSLLSPEGNATFSNAHRKFHHSHKMMCRALLPENEADMNDETIWETLPEKVLCRVCFVRDISVVLLPCRHQILCSNCAEKCKKRPICRISVKERMHVYDV